MRLVDCTIRRRIERAQMMLLANFGSIKEIGAEVGLNDKAYFSRTFKKHTGFSPSKYLESMRI